MMGEKQQNKRKISLVESAFDTVSSLIVGLVTVAVIFLVLFRTVVVNGTSMCNTLQSGDRLILISRFYTLERGDIVVINRENDEPLIKRVIALAGDVVDIDPVTLQVSVNGTVLSEPYTISGITKRNFFQGPYQVPKNKIFVLGDNRPDSLDSRILGPLSVDDVLGEAVFRLFPFSAVGRIGNEGEVTFAAVEDRE